MPRGSVTIGGIPYKVRLCHTWKDVSHDGLAGPAHAEISYLDCSIHVRADAPRELQAQAFIHEIIHGVIEGYKIRELMDEEEGGHYEHAVDQLATGLAEALRSLGVDLYRTLPVERKK
jgi:hypothetical protein